MRGILSAGALAFLFAFFGTPAAIKLLVKRGYGQFIRDDGPTSHHTKRGTPTMGGTVIIGAVIASYFLTHLITQRAVTVSALLVLGLMTGLGLVGFLDDWLKVSRQRSLGLRARTKMFGQSVIAIAFAVAGLNFPDERGLTPVSLNLSTVRDTSITLGAVLVIIWVFFMITATSNGVNLTDGLDGLATGAAVMSFGAFILIGVIVCTCVCVCVRGADSIWVCVCVRVCVRDSVSVCVCEIGRAHV